MALKQNLPIIRVSYLPLVLVVLGVLDLTLLVSSRTPVPGCSYSASGVAQGHGDAVQAETPLERLVDRYEAGDISRTEFRTAVAAMADSSLPTELKCDFAQTIVLKARARPYRISRDVTVLPGVYLVIEAGTEIVVAPETNFTVAGRLYAIGEEAAPIRIRAIGKHKFGELKISSGPNQIVWAELSNGEQLLSVTHPPTTRTLVENSQFDNWSNAAISLRQSGGLHVRRSGFGHRSTFIDQYGETIRARQSGRVVIESSTFGRRRGYNDVIDFKDCAAGSWPVIAHNRFGGGEDDAIDLDSCSAFVVGNHIQNFRPHAVLDWIYPRSNGGGVTGGGAASRPVLINNVIDNSFHGVGFKDGARPVLINNTFVNNNIGAALYQSRRGKAKPSAVMINNLLWDNVSWRDDGIRQDIVLNGKWWPKYNQDDDVQATLDARYNIAASMPESFEGVRNSTEDPHLQYVKGIPIPRAGSSAIDTGLQSVSVDDVPMDQLRKFLSVDFLKAARTVEGQKFIRIDRGAVEANVHSPVAGAIRSK